MLSPVGDIEGLIRIMNWVVINDSECSHCWIPSACADLGGGVYEYAIALANGVYEFIFINGNTWNENEHIDGDCTNGQGNRTISVADAATDNGTPCFISCD